jgi:TusE/DsrC/DsvC family sulfur relay protein
VQRAFEQLYWHAILPGRDIAFVREGFFADPGQWREAMAPEIAASEGVGELTDRHWQVVKFMRHQYEEQGAAPNVRPLAVSSGVPVKELYQLFPKGPAKLAAKVAGVPKPRGCI